MKNLLKRSFIFVLVFAALCMSVSAEEMVSHENEQTGLQEIFHNEAPEESWELLNTEIILLESENPDPPPK